MAVTVGQPRSRVDMRLPLPGDRLSGGWELPVLERDMGELPHRNGSGSGEQLGSGHQVGPV